MPTLTRPPLTWTDSARDVDAAAPAHVHDATRRFAADVARPGLVVTVTGLPDQQQPDRTAYRVTVHIDPGPDRAPSVLVASVTIRARGDASKFVVRLGERTHRAVQVPELDAGDVVWQAACRVLTEHSNVA